MQRTNEEAGDPGNPLQPFDRHATGYRAGWDAHPLVRLQRARVWAACARHFRPGGEIVDVGCGPGTDALGLAALGYRVRACDASPGMVAVARGRGVDARVLPAERVGELGEVDGVLSDFGALNCVDLDAFGRALRLRPGGVLVAVVMGPACPAETVALLTRGRVREAWSRRRRTEVPLEGGTVRVRWLRPRDLAALPGLEVVHVEALGVLHPPADLGGRAGRRARWDALAGRLPGLRGWGDHTLVVARRR